MLDMILRRLQQALAQGLLDPKRAPAVQTFLQQVMGNAALNRGNASPGLGIGPSVPPATGMVPPTMGVTPSGVSAPGLGGGGGFLANAVSPPVIPGQYPGQAATPTGWFQEGSRPVGLPVTGAANGSIVPNPIVSPSTSPGSSGIISGEGGAAFQRTNPRPLGPPGRA